MDVGVLVSSKDLLTISGSLTYDFFMFECDTLASFISFYGSNRSTFFIDGLSYNRVDVSLNRIFELYRFFLESLYVRNVFVILDLL
jgi:hypothetical protein